MYTKKEWQELSTKEKLEEMYQLGMESTYGIRNAKSRDAFLDKVLKWEDK